MPQRSRRASAIPALSVCLGGFPGTDRALRELSAATGLIRHVTIADARPDSVELRFVAAMLSETPPRLLIVGAWADAYDALIEVAVSQGVRVAAFWTSTGGQSEIGREVDRLERVMDDARIQTRWFLHAPLAAALQHAAPGVAVMPAILPRVPGPVTVGPRRAHNAPLRIGLFSSPHEYHRKNVLNSLLAVARLGPAVELHVNGASRPGGYRAWLERLGLVYVDHGWMDDATYADVIGSLDVALQASFAESFNYVAAEHLVRGVPVVGSRMVPAIGMLPVHLREAFIVDNPDNPLAIAARVRALAGARGRALAAEAAAALRRRSPIQLRGATHQIRLALGTGRGRGVSKGSR